MLVILHLYNNNSICYKVLEVVEKPHDDLIDIPKEILINTKIKHLKYYSNNKKIIIIKKT